MRYVAAIVWLVLGLGCKKDSPPAAPFVLTPYKAVAVSKSNPMQIYVHYMPWFQSKPVDGYWGMHWTMANQNPDDSTDGQANIAAHYYPLIGPYSSNDPDVLEYHTLLMKYCGVDGALIDWYGTSNTNDYPALLQSSNAFISHVTKAGLDYAIVYEDRTLAAIAPNDTAVQRQKAAVDMAYLKDEYFEDANYIRLLQAPLLLVFGPIVFEEPILWQRIFSNAAIDPTLLTLWGEKGDAGAQAAGEFAWIWNGSTTDHNILVNNFYNQLVNHFQLGVAYPGFYDFYKNGGWGNGLGWSVDHDGGNTFSTLLALAADNNVSHLQIATWNDFGEGTMVEPSLEFGFDFLTQLQRFSGVMYGEVELKIIHALYKARKRYAGDAARQEKLDQVYYYLIALQIEEAKQVWQSL